MKLLLITYRIDPHDTLVGFVVGWLRQLARHATSVDVVCLSAAPLDLPANVRVHSLGKGDVGRLGVWRNFYRVLWQLRDITTVFCMFSPEYVLAAAPLAWLRGWPIVLWYTHRNVDLKLRLATALVQTVVTASEASFRLETPKKTIIGHGIDATRFVPGPTPPPPLRVLAVGRRAPIKHYELLIDATAIVLKSGDMDELDVRIIGGDEGSAPPDYAAQLQARIDRLGLTDHVTLVGGVPYDEVVREYQSATVHVNLCPTGGIDKAVLEGMASGVPTLVRNTQFAPLLGDDSALCLVESDAPDAIAARLVALLHLPPAQRQALAARLRTTTADNYGEAGLVAKLAAVLHEVTP